MRAATSPGAALNPSTIPADLGRRCAAAVQRVADFAVLAKPRLVLMAVATALVGFDLGSPAPLDHVRLLHMLVGTALAGAGALALNQLIEREADARMKRTRHRPIPGGRISPREALAFGAALVAAGLAWLVATTNVLCAAITAMTAITYLFVYTPLKRKTPLCTPVGALAGALPPVSGWAAAAGGLGPGALVLFAMLFFWQLPHSLAIASLYREDYARGGMLLLPVVDPLGRRTGRQSLVHGLMLLGVASVPALTGLAGPLYLLTELIAGSALVGCAAGLWRRGTALAARRLLAATLAYLPIVLALLAADRPASTWWIG